MGTCASNHNPHADMNWPPQPAVIGTAQHNILLCQQAISDKTRAHRKDHCVGEVERQCFWYCRAWNSSLLLITTQLLLLPVISRAAQCCIAQGCSGCKSTGGLGLRLLVPLEDDGAEPHRHHQLQAKGTLLLLL